MPFASDVLDGLNARAGEARDPGNFGAVVLLEQDETLLRLAACWRNVPAAVQPDPLLEVPPGLPEAAWLRWYWSHLEPDPIPVWIAVAGLPYASHIIRAAMLAVDNRMVHPDGTVSTWVEQYLSRVVQSSLGGSSGGRR